jgi:hypothetical protein
VTVVKRCFKCLRVRPIAEFYKHSMMRDGHLNKCKDCTRRDTAENRAKRIDYYRAYDMVRYAESGQRGEASDEAKRRSGKAWKERNADKMRAHQRVRSALSSGTLTRPSACERCSRPCRPQAHHHDYNAPLEVEWICSRCHASVHRKRDPKKDIDTVLRGSPRMAKRFGASL